MGVLKDIWKKTSFARNAEKKKEEQQYEEQLRQEVREESKDALKQIMKDKILQEEKDKILGTGVKKENKGATILAQLGREFKESNIGSTDKMNQLLGQKNSGNVKDKGNLIGGNSFMSNDKISNLISSPNKRKFRDDYSDVIGMGKRGKKFKYDK